MPVEGPRLSGDASATDETEAGAESQTDYGAVEPTADPELDGPPQVDRTIEGNGAVDSATRRDGDTGEIPVPTPANDGDEAEDELRRRDRRLAARHEARRVRRVVRKIDPWSVLKVSLIFYACMYVIVMVAAVLLWSAAASSGTVDNIEDFVVDLGFSDFQFQADQMFRAALFGGAILMVIGTGFTVLCSILFNMISDLVGGVRVTMIEQEVEGRRSADEQVAASR